jgi:hypothetical protein
MKFGFIANSGYPSEHLAIFRRAYGNDRSASLATGTGSCSAFGLRIAG